MPQLGRVCHQRPDASICAGAHDHTTSVTRNRAFPIQLVLVAALVLTLGTTWPTSVPVKHWGPTGSMGTPRAFATLTRLLDGRLLVAGGYNGTFLSSAEIYDPVSGTWAPTGSMGSPRFHHTATRLLDGMVLVAGGADGTTAL